ncbi:MAG: protoheme IX farnesyltransferase [Armatimonadetes bacterium]|nr:protoheme IX farnesyltransferase [Armatimonadota bacterium]
MNPQKGFNLFRNFIADPQTAGDEKGNRLAGNPAFAAFSWFFLVYNFLVVAWGVFLRSMGFGDGCGANWPLCTGPKDPAKGSIATLIESSHRFSTELVGLLALIMVIWAFRAFSKGHPARWASSVVLAFTCVEALIGRYLVVKGLVTSNATVERAQWMGLHVLSTFMLLGSIAVAALAASEIRPIRLKSQGTVGWLLAFGFIGTMLLGVSGAISAFGHQVRPDVEGLSEMLKPTAFWANKLAVAHPVGSASISLYLLLMCSLVQHLRPDRFVKNASKMLIGALVIQLAVGALNIFFKAPVGLQMVHLVLADLNWVTVVVLAVAAFGVGIEPVESRPAPEAAETSEPLRGKELIKAYVALTKPRVISLLLFTTMTAMVAAKGTWPGTFLFIVVSLAGYMVAGAANTINMVIDRDIDITMKRTKKRPTVTQSISSIHALVFAFALASLSFVLLWVFATPLSALMGLSGLVFYVVIYTMLLKRRTWHNIVIGGAAGAFPPLVGWAAVTNDLPPLALYLFGIIFVWTPVHFWALALLIKDDYAAAGVPMLPVVKGDRVTVIQIGVYTVATILATFVPAFFPQVGWIYTISAIVLNLILIRSFWRLWKNMSDRPRASSLFHYSMLYLAILFLMFAIDRVVVMG